MEKRYWTQLKEKKGVGMKAVLLASGEGTNAENILAFSKEREEALDIVGVISDQAHAYVLERVKKWDVPTALIKREKRDRHEEDILAQIKRWGADWIFLAGYMRILGPRILSTFFDPHLGHSRIVNIHPSLLPRFRGLKAYEQAFKANVSESGVSVHFVDHGVDTGPLILQKSFPRLPGDTFLEFQKRGKKMEWRAYREAIDILLSKKLNDHQLRG
jgi:phosphoribosylglycinamide formyltransferase-1